MRIQIGRKRTMGFFTKRPDAPATSGVSRKSLPAIYPYFKHFDVSGGLSAGSIVTLSGPLQIDSASVESPSRSGEIPQSIFPVTRSFADLGLFYAEDQNDRGLRLCNPSDLARWEMTFDDLHAFAMSHLQRLVQDQYHAIGRPGDTMMFVVDGNFEGGLLLIPEFWDQWQGDFEGGVVVAVPSRDVVLVTGRNNVNGIATIKMQAQQILSTGNHPLSNYCFYRQGQQWAVHSQIADPELRQ
jgi:hypothetical protein